MADNLPGNWEGAGPGEGIGNGPDRTFTHWYANHDPESVSQPRDDSETKVLELEVYHDSGNEEYYALVYEATRDAESGDNKSSRQIGRAVVEVDSEYNSPGHRVVESHEVAEDAIFEEARDLMRKHP